MTTETIRTKDAAEQLLKHAHAEGLDKLSREAWSNFFEDIGVPSNRYGLALGHGTRNKWWTVHKASGELRIVSNRNGTAPDPPGDLPALENTEEELRNFAIKIGIQNDKPTRVAFILSKYDYNSPADLKSGLRQCPINEIEKQRFYTMWLRGQGILDAPAWHDLGVEDNPFQPSARKGGGWIVIDGVPTKLPPGERGGMDIWEAQIVAKAERDVAANNAPSTFGALDGVIGPILSTLLERAMDPPRPQLPDGTSLEVFKYLRESEFKTEALAMVKHNFPELIAMGKDAASATRQLAAQRGHNIPEQQTPAQDQDDLIPVVCRDCSTQQTISGPTAFACVGCQTVRNPDGSLYHVPEPEPQDPPTITTTIHRRPQPPEDDLNSDPELTQPIPVDLDDVPVAPATNIT